MLGKSELRNVFENIAASIIRDHNIRVIPSNRCETDTKQRIFFPFNSEYFKGFDKNVLHGKLDHEICHILDERERKEQGQQTTGSILKKIKGAKLKILFNLYIDILMERTYSDRLVGISQNLRSHQLDSSRFLRERMKEGGGLTSFGILCCGILSVANGVEYDSWMPIEFHGFTTLFSEEIRRIDEMVIPLDALQLAKDTLKKMRKLNLINKREVNLEDHSEGIDFEFKIEDIDDLSKLVGNYIKDKYRELGGDYQPSENVLRFDKWKNAEEGTEKEYQKCVQLISDQTKVLKKRFILILKAKTKCKKIYGQLEGDFDNDELASFLVGNKDVYYRIKKGKKIDTAELILIDLSGSMGRNNVIQHTAYHARLALIALAQTNDFLKIPFEAIGFRNIYAVWTKPGRNNVRSVSFEYIIFKAFNELYSRTKRRFTSVSGRGDNVDGEAFVTAAKRLNKRREARKILTVISDGRPQCYGLSTSILENQLENNIKMVSNSGIEVFGVGVGPAAYCVKRFYRKENGARNIFVPNVSDFALEMCRERTKIFGGKR